MTASRLETKGAIAEATLAGPLDADRVSELAEFCARIAEDDDVRVLLFRAAPEAWAGWSDGAYEQAEALGLIGDPFGPLAGLPQPTVAVLEGAVCGGGLELALCADIRIAGAGASFALAGPGGGALPIAGGLQRLARAVGRPHALELALAGASIDAATAQQWGLVTWVGEEPLAEARALAGRIAERGPIATRFAKEAVHRGLEMPLDQALRYETDLTVLLQTTADRAEGVSAFLEKRPPRFRGD